MVAGVITTLIELVGPAVLDLVGNAGDRARLSEFFATGWSPFARTALEAVTTEGKAA
jgi:hypothetical protein